MANFLALIPARKGSKGVPGKNKKLLAGKPLIEYTLQAAKDCFAIENIHISTDDEDILQLAKQLGLNSEYKRPTELSQDESTMSEVVAHALNWRKARHFSDTHVVLLQPTSPFRKTEDILNALALATTSGKSVLGVSPMWTHPFECIKVEDSSWSYLAQPDSPINQRQSYSENFYFINGSIYVFSVAEFLQSKKIPIAHAELLKMDRINSLDIDTKLDFAIAQALMQNLTV